MVARGKRNGGMTIDAGIGIMNAAGMPAACLKNRAPEGRPGGVRCIGVNHALGGLLLGLFFAAASSLAAEPQRLRLAWRDNFLAVSRADLPGETVTTQYLEAYCRDGSADRDWHETVIGHQTRLVHASDDGHELALECRLRDGVIVKHQIVAGTDEVDFRLTAHNPTGVESRAHWAQPCTRVDRWTGKGQNDYLNSLFVILDGRPTRLPTAPWATKARYVPGQVYVPRGVDRHDVNPRPASDLVVSHGLVGCFSADEKWILAAAWEPWQELFQGVIVCVHSDFRLGGLKPGETKKIRGKLYLVRSSVDELLRRYERDFPEHFRKP